MKKKVLYSFARETNLYGRIVTCGLIISMISYVIWSFNDQINECHESIFSRSTTETIGNSTLLQCNISYDECRCSVISNKFNNSIKCITNIQAMIGPMLPPVSFVLQIYLIYKLISLAGNLRRIQKNLFWFAALIVFIITAVTAQGSSCLYSYTSDTACFSGFFLFVVVCYLAIHSKVEYPFAFQDGSS
jgi:hypothetical protein